MRPMYGLDYVYSLAEWRIAGRHLSKLYERKGLYYLRFGSEDIVIQPGRRAHLTIRRPEMGNPTAETGFLRKRFLGKRLRSFGLLGGDRILFFDFGELTLAFEMFGGGDRLVLRGEEVLSSRRGRSGKIRPKVLRPSEVSPSPQPIGKLLSSLPWGSPYVKYILEQAEIPENEEATPENLGEFFSKAMELLSQAGPRWKPGDYFLLPREGYSDWQGPFSRLLDRLYAGERPSPPRRKEQVKNDLRKIAEWIWKHADYVDSLLARVRKGERPPEVKEINWKSRWIIVEVEDEGD